MGCHGQRVKTARHLYDRLSGFSQAPPPARENVGASTRPARAGDKHRGSVMHG
eukprot:ctg_3844.g613